MTRDRPYLGTFAVFVGVAIASIGQRVLNVGLPDLRGALGLGFDEAAWLPTAGNMALMFMGPFSVYLARIYGHRRILLVAGPVFATTSLLAPMAPSFSVLLAIQVIGALAAGTFYPISLGYAVGHIPQPYLVFGLSAFSIEVIGALSLGTPLQAFFDEHGSWRWIFWHNAVLVALMIFFVLRAVPKVPIAEDRVPITRLPAFFLGSLGASLLIAVFEQGERLDWLESDVIVAMATSGVLLLLGALAVGAAFGGVLNLGFLANRNILLVGVLLFGVRFVLLGVVTVLPGYLGIVQGYRPLEIGAVLLWLVAPAAFFGIATAWLMRHLDPRLVTAFGIVLVAVACVLDAQLTSEWAATEFRLAQLIMAAGLAILFTGTIGLVFTTASATGATKDKTNITTLVAFYQVVRLVGGTAGASTLGHFVVTRERLHSNLLGLHVESASALTEERLALLGGAVRASSAGADEAPRRALALLAGQVAREAYTLTYADAFLVIAWFCVLLLVCVAALRPAQNYFRVAAAAVVVLVLFVPRPASAREPEDAPLSALLAQRIGRPGGLTADQVAARAVATSPDLAAARSGLVEARAGVDEAAVGFAPKLTIDASYTRLSRVTAPRAGTLLVAPSQADGALPPGATIVAVPFVISPTPLDHTSAQAALDVPLSDYLFRLGQAHSGAQHLERAAALDARTAQVKVDADARIAYYEWARARLSVTVAGRAVDQLRQHLRDVRSLFDAGAAALADVLRVESQVAADELVLKQASSLEKASAEQLETTMHVRGATWEIGEDLSAVLAADETADLDALLASAIRDRPEIAALGENEVALLRQASVARASVLPRLSAFGEVTTADPNDRYQPNLQRFDTTWSAGVRLTWSPNEAAVGAARERQLDAKAAEIAARRAAVVDALRTEISRALQLWDDARAAVETSARSLAASEESYRARRALFVSQHATNVEMLDAEVDLLRVRLDVVSSRIDQRVAKVRLDHATGRDARRAATR